MCYACIVGLLKSNTAQDAHRIAELEAERDGALDAWAEMILAIGNFLGVSWHKSVWSDAQFWTEQVQPALGRQHERTKALEAATDEWRTAARAEAGMVNDLNAEVRRLRGFEAALRELVVLKDLKDEMGRPESATNPPNLRFQQIQRDYDIRVHPAWAQARKLLEETQP
jgi:hypothetical protein